MGNKWQAEYNREERIPDDLSTMERLKFKTDNSPVVFVESIALGVLEILSFGELSKFANPEVTSVTFPKRLPPVYLHKDPASHLWFPKMLKSPLP